MKQLTLILLIFPVFVSAQSVNPSDSIHTALDEVVVTGKVVTETTKKVILYPTRQHKRHSTNGYQLLANMNLPDVETDAQTKSISMTNGQAVQILINGIEAQSDELATLPASEITRIDLQRNPGGRYVGKGAVMNFITRQYDSGGNIYISADEGLLRQYGNYTGQADYRKKAVSFSLIANGTWQHTSQLNTSDNTFRLSNGLLHQTIIPQENKTRSNTFYGSLKFKHAIANHSFDASLSLNRTATPRRFIADEMIYKGLYDFNTLAVRQSRELTVYPSLNVHYSLVTPKGSIIYLTGDISFGHTDFNSMSTETDKETILNDTEEENLNWSLTASWFRDLPHNINIGLTADNLYSHYRDCYSGSFNALQKLMNNHAQLTLHWQQQLPAGIYYYISAGLSDLYSTLGNRCDNQLTPMAFYGANYALNRDHSISITGNYLHSIYNPSYKNDAVILTSFFQANAGNPDLRQLKCFQNMISYNGHIDALGLTATYDFMKYYDNTSHDYYVENDIVYNRLINDGSFHNHRFIAGASLNLLDGRFKSNANITYSLYRFNSLTRPARSNNLRFSCNASFAFGDWQIKGIWSPSFRGTDIEGESFRMSSQYGIIVNWNHGKWAVECTLKNFLHRYRSVDRTVTYDCYYSVSKNLSDAIGRNMCLSLTYILPYGKKTDREKAEIGNAVNSAILRPF